MYILISNIRCFNDWCYNLFSWLWWSKWGINSFKDNWRKIYGNCSSSIM